MANILDYLTWRGDIPFEQVELNEIDSLILSRVSYLPFDNLIKENEYITIEQAYKRFEDNGKKGVILQKEDLDLFPLLAKCKRYKDLVIAEYINKVDILEEKQFSAITIFLTKNISYISYRGTDNTLIGWKEDFNMSFSSNLPAQKDAVNYLNQIAKKYRGEFIVGGHSKGGNLAVYASTFCKDKVKKRIKIVYNEDGPGFDNEITQTKEYIDMIKKVHTYIPQSSIFGRLLNHQETYTVVRSTAVGIMQHDLYSWQVLGGKFETLENVTYESELMNTAIRKWLAEVSQEKKEKFFNILFNILISTEASTVEELANNWFKISKKIVKEYSEIDPENKEIIAETFHLFLSIVKDNIKERFSTKERANNNKK